MSVEPFNVEPVIRRLRDRTSPQELREVGGRGDYAAIRNLKGFPTPAVFVLLARERATRTPEGGAMPGEQVSVAQVVDVRFATVLGARNFRRLSGEELRDEMRTQAALVRRHLLGWVPDLPGAISCQLVSGDLGAYDNETALWTDVWSTQHVITSESAP